MKVKDIIVEILHSDLTVDALETISRVAKRRAENEKIKNSCG